MVNENRKEVPKVDCLCENDQKKTEMYPYTLTSYFHFYLLAVSVYHTRIHPHLNIEELFTTLIFIQNTWVAKSFFPGEEKAREFSDWLEKLGKNLKKSGKSEEIQNKFLITVNGNL